jgi:hypothetical protein
MNSGAVKILYFMGPPNSPPIIEVRLIIIIVTAMSAKQQNKVTENAKLPGTTTNLVPL